MRRLINRSFNPKDSRRYYYAHVRIWQWKRKDLIISENYAKHIRARFLISEVAFHGYTGSSVVRFVPGSQYSEPVKKVPSPWLLEPSDDIDVPPVEHILETIGPMSWSVWSVLIDLKLFGRETPFSRIPNPDTL